MPSFQRPDEIIADSASRTPRRIKSAASLDDNGSRYVRMFPIKRGQLVKSNVVVRAARHLVFSQSIIR
jgi:hypothetical protein